MLTRLAVVISMLVLVLSVEGCKKSGGGKSGGSSLSKEKISGMWGADSSENDGKTTDYASNETSLMYIDSDSFSSVGQGPFGGSCAVDLSYVISGKTIRVAKNDSCNGMDLKVKSLSASKMVIEDGKTLHTFSIISDATAEAVLVAHGYNVNNVTSLAPAFRGLIDTGSTPSPAPGTGSSPYDAELFTTLKDYRLTVAQSTTYAQTLKPSLVSYRRLYFQNGVILAANATISGNDGDSYCEVMFNSSSVEAENTLQQGATIDFSNAVISLFSKSYAYPKAASNVLVIECTKYGKQKMTIGDLTKALGSYVTISKL